MSEVISPTPVSPKQVDTDDGPVTVTTIDYLEGLSVQKQLELKQLADEVKHLDGETAEMQVQAGRVLTSSSSAWTSTERSPLIEAAQGLELLVSSLDSTIAETTARPHHGIVGLIQSLMDKHEGAELHTQLESANGELD